MKKRKIVWLCSWYPDKTEPYNGDFVKRHAEAVSAFCDLHVIHVVRDKEGMVTKSVKTEEVTGSFTETIIYYYVPVTGIGLLEKFLSQQWHEKLYRRAVESYIAQNGLPDLVHVHMGMKAGTTALWMKKKYKVPYVVSEHWSGFLDNAEEQFSKTPRRFQKTWTGIIQNAAGVCAVSEVLAAGLKKNFEGLNPVVIPNVVNTKIFYPDVQQQSSAFQFVHVSGMQPLKNPQLIVSAFQKLLESFPAARLNMIGGKDDQLISFVKENGLEHAITFYDEIPQPELAEFVRQSVALILFSSYETFGCVIIEANASAVPVIVSDIPVFHETVNEPFSGYFAKPGDTESLMAAMKKAIAEKDHYDKEKLASATAAKYAYPAVGKRMVDWYEQVLKKD